MRQQRFFCAFTFALVLPVVCCATDSAARDSTPRKAESGRLVEIEATARSEHRDPFNEVTLDFVFTDPDGQTLRVPAFWAGGPTWKARYSSRKQGVHRYRSECSDTKDAGLHGLEGQVEVVAYSGDNPLFAHGPLRVSADRRHFEHADGKPFLWLGDTWWMGLTKRLKWPEEFERLAADRKQKGFNVIQIVAGLYPDMPAFDERGANESGFPWEKDYARIRPEYFNVADRRLMYLVDQGFVPCIVAGWGYHLPLLGVERMQKHWRNLIARYGALPVTWCLAGEGIMPYYLEKERQKAMDFQKHGWTEVARYVRKTDPFKRLLSVHPSDTARNMIDDQSLLDFDMLQTGHGDRASIPPTIRAVRASVAAKPKMPTVNSEVCYEGILNTCFADLQRFMVWSCLLSGEAGHTYGANGIWQVNRRERPYGKSPHGGNWGNTPWDDAMKLPGSGQTGLAKKLIERFAWHQFEPHQEWASYRQPSKDEFDTPYAAGIAGQVRVIYVPRSTPILVKHLEHTVPYQATYFDPVTGAESVAGLVQPDERGTWDVSPPAGVDHDWVLVLGQPQMGRADRGTANRAIAIHPDNPKYFLFRGKPLALISASEHYGSVVNRAFDFRRYLRDAADKKQTMTRTFLLFREQQSSRNPSSPVKPESPDFVAPYVRSGPGVALDGEPVYDLDRSNPEYFARLDDFLRLASKLRVVVELTLLSNTYADPVWALNPLNAQNNVQRVGKVHWADYTSLKDRGLVERQKAHVRKIVRTTSSYDNVYYEICNEPGGGQPGHATPADVDAWQAEIAAAVREELAKLGREHLVFGSQAFTYTPIFRQPLDATFSGKVFDVVNVHPLPNTVLDGRDWMLGGFMSKELTLGELAGFCRAAQSKSKPCVLDEDNTASLYRDETGWTIHRKRAWMALMSQSHYDYIDFSITAGNESGTRASQRQLRAWFKNLSEFFHGLDFIHLAPVEDWIEKKPAHVVSAVLGRPGEQYCAYLADAREVTAPDAGQPIDGPVSLRLPSGRWHCELYSPTSGMHSPGVSLRSTGEAVTVNLTPFVHDVVLCVKRAPEVD